MDVIANLLDEFANLLWHILPQLFITLIVEVSKKFLGKNKRSKFFLKQCKKRIWLPENRVSTSIVIAKYHKSTSHLLRLVELAQWKLNT